MLGGDFVTLALGLALAGAPAEAPKAEPVVTPAGVLAAFDAAQPGCGDAKYCFGVHLHVVTREGEWAQSPEWLATQLAEANRHFEKIHSAFKIVDADEIGREWAHIATREQRDDLGRNRFSRGVIHLFLIEQLDDVDAPGEQIRGLHWRQRSKISKRWVLLSKIAPTMVLAHEFGHFFGLPHSTYAASIMNKRRREHPPREERSFVTQEVVIMRQRRNEMIAERMLRRQR